MMAKKEIHRALLILIIIKLISNSNVTRNACDVTINSTESSLFAKTSKNGTISSPNFPENYGPNLRCIYRFIGSQKERVRIEFKEFEVKGVPPTCQHDYIDVYTQVEKPYQDLLQVPMHGRYCGSGLDLLPNILISMNNVLIIGFFTDHQKEDKGFSADYHFIENSLYIIGTPAPKGQCGQTIYGTSKSSGFIYSPTYPGVYPDNVFCFYRLIGIQRQRIKLTFDEIDLYSGGDHCPFDYVRVYDGPTNNSDIIGTYCGHRNNVTLFSSSSNIYIEFSTKSGRVESTKRTYLPLWDTHRTDDVVIQRRGFKAAYEISGTFVDLAFIEDGFHVRGTECDQMVLSKKESSGVIKSPNFPKNFPLKIKCSYYIDGLEDKQNLEKAKIDFDYLNIPKIRDGCNNGHLSVYLKGQIDKPDHILCGPTTPSPLTSSNPRLLLVFNTLHANYAGKGFKARIQFLTDFAIPGTPATDGFKCHFEYRSSSSNQGTFNSPRHPSNYPDDAACLYEFIGSTGEQIRITFETFKLEGDPPSCSTTDFIQVFNVFPKSNNKDSQWPFENNLSVTPSFHDKKLPFSLSEYIDPQTDRLTGLYCGEVLPGPQLSEENTQSVKLLFITNSEGVNAGFKAKYEFIEKNSPDKRCFYDITAGTGSSTGGQILSPNYPHKYLINSTCEWFIMSKQPYGRILLIFNFFSMEGNIDKQGCGNAVLKIYSNNTDWPSHELCGITVEGTTILSNNNFLRLKFISSARAIGAKGFKLTWTEVLSIVEKDSECPGFRCKNTGYCIATDLKCNKMTNCGKNDVSDETPNCHAYQDTGLIYIIISVAAFFSFVAIIVIACVIQQRKSSRVPKYKSNVELRFNMSDRTFPSSPGPVCKPSYPYNTTKDGKIIKEQTEKVSIV